MIESTAATSAARFMFVLEDEIIFCTSDLNTYKEYINPHEIGQISTGDHIEIYDISYLIESIQIEHYSWPMDSQVFNQTGHPYLYTVNITLNLSKVYED
ncbi:hypothetical protein HH214_03195 [Mucilaginibacter robiniae]|uniref:Uncharacterized protein n=1 Tax=Mucilaginibacter robiniae TaxID=2728022 RepID=A0A7L5E097_9SPHI|nr:hypothetical protein [Mucilaginibacter robiniae]QJD94954.1 hypothetical protein HH214_03195 [Mucilaginibacter robiniae]